MHFIREAGYGIWPVLAFGIAALVVAARQALAPAAGRVLTVTWLMALTLVFGVLGTAIGLQTAVGALPQVAADTRWIFLLGLNEALNNLVAALVLVALTLLVLTYAQVRGSSALKPQREPSPSSARA